MLIYCNGTDALDSNTNIVLFDYHNSRRAQCAIDFLNGYQGYMHVDGYKADESTQATLPPFLAHIRRKFIDVKSGCRIKFNWKAIRNRKTNYR